MEPPKAMLCDQEPPPVRYRRDATAFRRRSHMQSARTAYADLPSALSRRSSEVVGINRAPHKATYSDVRMSRYHVSASLSLPSLQRAIARRVPRDQGGRSSKRTT